MDQTDTTHTFDGKAETYARNRLDYSPQAIEAIVNAAGLGTTSAIADLGAGTGMLTRHFVGRVGQVFAIEPNDDMRALALSRLQGLESWRVMKATAHDTGLPDHSVDAVVAGRALRWFDPKPTQAEIRRILRPGGWLVALATPARDPHSRAALKRLRDMRISQHDASRHHKRELVLSTYFEGDDNLRFAYPCVAYETWPEFLGRMQSMSFAPQSGHTNHADFERVAREIFEGSATDGTLRVDYATEVLMKKM